MSRRRGLGSGLDALIPAATVSGTQSVRMIPVDQIHENRSQPRTHFDEQALDELAASIREHGIIQPLVVSEDSAGGFELIAGERRWRAARRAGMAEVPALVKSATHQQLLELALVENVQRADLNALEEGLAYQTLKDDFGLTDEMIAQRVGKSRVAVVNARRLIRLAAPARQALLDATITAGHGRALLRFEDEAMQGVALDLIVRRDLSVRELERICEVALQPALSIDVRDALLGGTISLAHAQAMLRVDDTDMQAQILGSVLAYGLGSRETERLCGLLVEGAALDYALAQVQERGTLLGGAAAPERRSDRAPQSVDTREPPAVAPEDAEARRLFEELLQTPVQISRSGSTIRLTVTLYDDEQLQRIYELLGGT